MREISRRVAILERTAKRPAGGPDLGYLTLGEAYFCLWCLGDEELADSEKWPDGDPTEADMARMRELLRL